jgi:hypothetical protein
MDGWTYKGVWTAMRHEMCVRGGGMGVKWDIVIGRGSDRSSLRTGRQKWMYWTYGAHLYSDRKMDEHCPWAWDDIWVGDWG